MGAFENEIMLWLHNLRQSFYKHERFTWINLVLSIIPLPAFGLFAILLACIQLYLCSKGKIPKTEEYLLYLSLLFGIINLTLATIVIIYLVKEGWSLWQMFNPLLWLNPLKEKLLNRDTVNVIFT